MNVRVFSLIVAAGLALAVPLVPNAQSVPENWDKYSWEIPVRRGEYIPIDGGTLGTLSAGFTEDANRTFGGASLYYDENGNPVTVAVSGQVHYNDDAVVAQTGVIAWTDISTYRLWDGPCRGCADHPRQQAQTSDVARFEWTGPRGGRLTMNGVTQKMAEAFTGLPLIAPTDYSGVYLMVFRTASLQGDGSVYQGEGTHLVRLTSVAELRSYVTDVDVRFPPWGSVALPPTGAHLYDAVILTGPPWMLYDSTWMPTLPSGATPEFTFWFGDDGAGRLLGVVLANGTRTVFDRGYEYPRVYGTSDRIVGRRLPSPAQPDVMLEFALFRISPQTLDGAFKLPCSQISPGPQPMPPCSPYD